MKGRVSTLIRKALENEASRKILRRVIAEGIDATIVIEDIKYRVVSSNSKRNKEKEFKTPNLME